MQAADVGVRNLVPNLAGTDALATTLPPPPPPSSFINVFITNHKCQETKTETLHGCLVGTVMNVPFLS